MSDEYHDEEEAVEKRASYVRDNLPAPLPFEAPSYLVQHSELGGRGRQPACHSAIRGAKLLGPAQ
jgi:hypothetical protein